MINGACACYHKGRENQPQQGARGEEIESSGMQSKEQPWGRKHRTNMRCKKTCGVTIHRICRRIRPQISVNQTPFGNG